MFAKIPLGGTKPLSAHRLEAPNKQTILNQINNTIKVGIYHHDSTTVTSCHMQDRKGRNLTQGWEGWARKPVNHTSWVAVVTPADRPKSVRNRCVIELFVALFVLSLCPFLQFCWCRGICHRTESDLFLFLSKVTTTSEKYKKATWQHKNATKNVDYDTIEDRLRRVRWSNNNHLICVFKPVNGYPFFPLTTKAMQSKELTF